MKYCRNCGKEMDDNAMICTTCGVPVDEKLYKKATTPDSSNFGWGALGFFFPLAGLILYLIWKDEKPLTAKSAGKGALISVILNIALSLIIFIVALATIPYQGYLYH